MNKAIKSVFLVLGIGILSLIPESLSAVEWSATWTGAENGFWTNANNWVDGQIGGRWLVKDAGGHVVTNGALGCTVYFDENGASGATTINFDGVVSASNILVRGGSAAPRYTFGTVTTQTISLESYGTFSAAETADTPVAIIGGKFGGVVEATGRVYGGDWITYRNNNTSETLVLERWGGPQIWAGPKTDVDKHNGEPRIIFDGAGDIRLDADSQYKTVNSGNHQYTMRMRGKLIINCDFKSIRAMVFSGGYPHTIEILAGKAFRHATGYYNFLAVEANNPLIFMGEGFVSFGAGYASGVWKDSQNSVSSDLTFLCPVTSVRTTSGHTDAEWMAGATFNGGASTITFAGTTTITGTVALISSASGLTAGYNSLGLRSGSWENDFFVDNNATIRYLGEGETTDRSICVTNTASSRPHTVTLEQAGTGAFVANSAITKTANVTAPTFVLRNDTAQPAAFGGTLGDDFKLTKNGTGVWTISSALTHTGTTTVEAGTLRLASSASLDNTSGIALGATAELEVQGDGLGAVERTLPALSATGGAAVLRIDAGVTLTLASLNATAAGTLDIVTTDATAQLKVSGGISGNAPGWLTLNGRLAEFDENGFLRKRTVSVDTNIPAYGGVIPDDATKVVGVTTVGTEGDGPITLAANATAVSALAQKTSVEAIVDMAAGQTLTAGMLFQGDGCGPLTIGSAHGQGTLAAASGEFTVWPEEAGGQITVNATPSLGAATTLVKAGYGDARFATNFAYSGSVQIVGGELAVTPAGSLQTFALNGGGTFAKEGAGAWTVPSGKNAGFSGAYIVRGGTVTPGSSSAAMLFGAEDQGELVISNGAAFHYGPTLASALDFGHKRVRLAGDGPDGEGAFVVDMPASRTANAVSIPFLTLDGDASMNITNVASSSHYIGLAADDPGVFDMQGHTFTRKGGCRLVVKYCTITNGGAIRLEGPASNNGKKEYNGFLVLQNDLNFTDTPPTIYMTNNSYLCTQNCSPVPCPIEIAPNSLVWAGTFASNTDTNFNNLAGPIHLADETSVLALDCFADGTRLLTLSGEISGSGIITNSGGSSKYFIAAPVNTFTGKTCIALPAGSGSFGSITYARPASLPDFSKATFNGYGTANVRVSSDQSSWPHAEIGRLMREATFVTGAMVGVDTTDTGDYTIDVSSLGTVPTRLSGLAIAATRPNNDVLTLNLDADYKGYSSFGLGTYCGTLRVVGTGGELGLRTFRLSADRVAGITGTLEITDRATVRMAAGSNSTVCGTDDSYCILRIVNGTLDLQEDQTSSGFSISVGGVTKSRGIVDVRQDGEVRNARFTLGGGPNARGGALYLSGNAKVGLSANPTYIGNTCGGYIDMSNGEIACAGGGYLRVGNPSVSYAGTYGIISQSGGQLRIASDTGLVGGTCDQAGFIRLTGDAEFLVDPKVWTHALEWPCSASTTGISTGSLGVITLDSANAHFLAASNKVVFLANQPNGTAVVNLNAGVFEMGKYEACANGHAGSAAYVNFNGGTLKANADNADFLKGTTRVLLDAGGATVNTAGHDVTIKEPFAAPTGSGIASIALPDNLAKTENAHMPWAVRIEGDGTGATAIIAHDRATQRMTHVIVTSPGCNYTTAKAIFWPGMTGSSVKDRPDKPITNDCVLVANAAPGVFTKKGAGTFTFGAGGGLPAGASVDVQEGTLDLNGTSANLTNVASSGNGTIINGAAAIPLPSTMAIDVASAQAGHYLTVGGNATLPTTLTLQNVGQVGATAKSFTILKVTGTATGALPAIDPATPVPPAWQLYWTGSELKLGVPRATHLYFR